MEYDIEIHTRNSGEKIVSVGIGGRMVAMTAFEWLQLCEQVVTEINRHITPLALDAAMPPSAEPLSGLESVPAVEFDTQPRRRKEVMETCCICEKETIEISFRFGYGSSFDGESVCWDCASKLDSAVIAAQHNQGEN
jgi:hypothetical protein